MIDSGMFQEAGRKMMELIDDPPCPRFPDLSIFIYQFASALWAILWFLGLPSWPWAGIVGRLNFRAWKVAWARATRQQRMNHMFLSAVVMPVGLMAADPERFEKLLEKARAAEEAAA